MGPQNDEARNHASLLFAAERKGERAPHGLHIKKASVIYCSFWRLPLFIVAEISRLMMK